MVFMYSEPLVVKAVFGSPEEYKMHSLQELQIKKEYKQLKKIIDKH